MITEEEKEEIINKAVERTLLKIPEVVGNLMTNYAAKIRINTEFYKEHPEFNNYREVVASVIEMVESADPTKDFKDIVESAVPKIRKRIDELKPLDTKTVSKPKLDIPFGSGEL